MIWLQASKLLRKKPQFANLVEFSSDARRFYEIRSTGLGYLLELRLISRPSVVEQSYSATDILTAREVAQYVSEEMASRPETTLAPPFAPARRTEDRHAH